MDRLDGREELLHARFENRWRRSPCDEGEEQVVALRDRDLPLVDLEVPQFPATATRGAERVLHKLSDEREHSRNRDVVLNRVLRSADPCHEPAVFVDQEEIRRDEGLPQDSPRNRPGGQDDRDKHRDPEEEVGREPGRSGDEEAHRE